MTKKRCISLAPMMEVTDKHFRVFTRLLSKHIFNYTEMVTSGAIIHGPRERLLDYSAIEHPIAVQLGGSDPSDLSECAKICEQKGYDEINLNIGCPSDRVQDGNIGVCLMLKPEQVAKCVIAMKKAVNIPITIKTRVGVDNNDSYSFLHDFIQCQKNAGCDFFILHARKAWLKGLSPKENRTVPELEYEKVYRLVEDFPELTFELNGGITDLTMAQTAVDKVGSAMMGRAIWDNPWMIHDIDHRFHQSPNPCATRQEVIEKYIPYIEEQLAKGVSINRLTPPLLGLFHQVSGSKKWRQFISINRKFHKNLLSEMLNLCSDLERKF